MSRELRRIFLNKDEVKRAVEAFRVTKPNFLPVGNITEIVATADNLVIKMNMNYVDGIQQHEFKVQYDKIVEMLASFCVAQRIRLPRAGKKTAYAMEDEVVLEISLGEAKAQKEAEWPRLRPLRAAGAPER